MGAIRTLLGMVPVSLLAWWFFGFSVYSMGLALAAFFASLILFGWAIGIAVCVLIMRYGMGVESAAWGTMLLILPVAAVYYPVTILPSSQAGRASIRHRACQYVLILVASVSFTKQHK